MPAQHYQDLTQDIYEYLLGQATIMHCKLYGIVSALQAKYPTKYQTALINYDKLYKAVNRRLVSLTQQRIIDASIISDNHSYRLAVPPGTPITCNFSLVRGRLFPVESTLDPAADVFSIVVWQDDSKRYYLNWDIKRHPITGELSLGVPINTGKLVSA
jgi:hypothetical protein